MTRRPATYHGVLPLNKPSGLTSHDAVDQVRRILGQRAVGHAGTLDPEATGLLVLLVGQGTKAARFLTDADKEYLAEIQLGLESPTYDREGVPEGSTTALDSFPGQSQVEESLGAFRGEITQAVPPYSAVHVDGERLYKLSRKGEETTPPQRTVTIHSLVLLEYSRGRLRVRVVCGKGTYVRSLAHDVGRKLGCGGYLYSLVRTRSGRFRLEDAHTLEALSNARERGELNRLIIPVDAALGFSTVTVDPEFRAKVSFGRRPTGRDIAGVQGEFQSGDHLLLKDKDGSLLAIATAVVPSGSLQAHPGREILKYDRVLA
ncbi:MAG: tRNA pseudouridine(55) synthase TruB [Candidatus Zixiibacteriota bacterium]